MARPSAERTLARQLRAEGWALREIAKHIGIALATASEWVRDVDGPAGTSAPALRYAPLRVWHSGEVRRCSRCELTLPTELFNRYRSGRQAWCRRCFLGYHDANKEAASGRRQARYLLACDFVRDHLESHPCADCGEADPVVLEFDHVQTKRDWVSRLMARGAPLDRIDEEIARCEVVCAARSELRLSLR